jgi:hypothetical protein
MALSFRKDDKERKQKSLERAQKEAEMASESAKDARNRREAKIVANKLEAPVEQNEEKQVVENVLDETKDEIKVATRKDAKEELTAMQREQQQVVNKALDETKDEIKVATRKDAKEELTAMQREQQQVVNKALDEIKVATREAAKEIPQYTQKLGDLQEQTIQTTREIADNYIESQKEIISIYQSVWTPFVENANSKFWNYWPVSPKGLAETYGTVVSSFADNVIAATRLTNNAISANMELFSTALQRTKDSSKEFSRLGVNAAKVFNEASNDFVTQVSLK